MTVYFEDVEVGEVRRFGTYEVTESELVEFAERYDPQPFHVDPEVAEERWGGLIASGWHTAAMTMRLLVDGLLSTASTAGAKGVDEVRWTRPVRPGDVLSARTTVVATELADAGDDYGVVRFRVETLNDDDEVVMRFVSQSMFDRRPDEADAGIDEADAGIDEADAGNDEADAGNDETDAGRDRED
jgi:acyl dehydratase